MSQPADPWNGDERRARPTQIPDNEFQRYMIAQLESLGAKMNAMHIDMVGHKADMANMSKDIDSIKRGFPKNDEGERDFDGHHDHHDGLIKTSKKWSDIGQDVLKKIFGGVAWLTVCFIGYAIYTAIKEALRK